MVTTSVYSDNHPQRIIYLNAAPFPAGNICLSCGVMPVERRGQLCNDAFYQCAEASAVWAAKRIGATWPR